MFPIQLATSLLEVSHAFSALLHVFWPFVFFLSLVRPNHRLCTIMENWTNKMLFKSTFWNYFCKFNFCKWNLFPMLGGRLMTGIPSFSRKCQKITRLSVSFHLVHTFACLSFNRNSEPIERRTKGFLHSISLWAISTHSKKPKTSSSMLLLILLFGQTRPAVTP